MTAFSKTSMADKRMVEGKSIAHLADGRWVGPHGIGRFASEVLRRLPHLHKLSVPVPPLHPLDPLFVTRAVFRAKPASYFSPGFNPPLASPCPVVFMIYDLIHLRFPSERSLLKEAYYRMIVRPGARRAFQVLTLSTFSQQEIMEWAGIGRDKVSVVHPGIGPEFNPHGPVHSSARPYLLYVGNRKPHKNLQRLFMGFRRADVGNDVTLLLSGTPDRGTLMQAKDAGILQQLSFAGSISDRDLPAYYRGALVLILPSLYEGAGLPVLEAMACGTPVLASDASALPETAGAAALLIDPYDVDAIGTGIKRLIEDNELRTTLRQAGSKRAREFSWEETAAVVGSVLEEAAAGGPES